MPNSTTFLGIDNTPQPYQVGLVITAAIYAGIFLMLSNHYVFKPKVQQYLGNSSVQSKACTQFLIDFISNLPQLTFIICTIAISNSDSGLSVMVYSDLTWSGLYVGLLAFRGLSNKQVGNWKLMLIKNMICLGLVYGTIWMHYLTQHYLVTLGLILFLLYFINLSIDAYQEKLVSVMQYLFRYKAEEQNQNKYSQRNRMISLDYLARHFPVTPDQIKQKMKIYEKEVKNIKIKTKSMVAHKLMKVAVAVHLSRQKREAKARRDVKNYYGTFNGTVGERSKRIIIEKPTTNDQIYSFQQSQERAQMVQAQQIDSCIFYIFPVKLFQNSKTLSVIFSITINVAYGILLSLALFLTDNLSDGAFAHLLYGFLLLPLLPNTNKIDFFTSMTLSSLWKYCLYGLTLCFYCLIGGSGVFNLGTSQTLIFSPMIQLLAMATLSYMLVGDQQPKYRVIFVWITAIGINSIFIFKSS